jgi:hypothetical protein
VTTTETLTFICSICGEPSGDICVACTKDACHNHRCIRCKRCSDCCGCDVPLSAAEAAVEPEYQRAPILEPEPHPEPLSVLPVSLDPPESIDTPESIAESMPELFRPDPEPSQE